MKANWCLVLVCAAVSVAAISAQLIDERVMNWIDLFSIFNTKRNSLSYHLYTTMSPKVPLRLVFGQGGRYTLAQPLKFNKNYPTKVILHGWLADASFEICGDLRDAFLQTGRYNVICVDWSAKGNAPYPLAVADVADVGRELAAVLDFLHKFVGLDFATLSLIGHSLGGHVAGIAGKHVKRAQIHEIVGMDVALPMFDRVDWSQRLHITDAYYVETIHTCAGYLGTVKPIGRASFYPNGGRFQPGCGIDVSGNCAHTRSYIYYAEAIRYNNFPAIKCDSYLEAMASSCGRKVSRVRMGGPTNYINAAGVFFVPVGDEAPHGLGATKRKTTG